VCTTCIEAFRLLTILPEARAARAGRAGEAFLECAALDFANAATPLGAGHVIGEYQHLMQRVDPKQLDALFEAPAQAGTPQPLLKL
jgi:methionyl-tRNA synthetase